MNKVTFYILQTGSDTENQQRAKHQPLADFGVADTELQRWKIAYKLCKKAMATGHVTVYCPHEWVNAVSDFFWSYQTTDFVAHALNNNDAPVNITHELNANSANVLINLSELVVAPQHYGRLLEIISTDESNKQKGRERYKAYKKQGMPLESHNISI